MKNIIKTLALAAIAAATLAACSVEDEQTSPVNNAKEYCYTFPLAGTDTRSTLDTNHVKWEADDNIGMYAVTDTSVSANKYSKVVIGTPCTMQVYTTTPLAAGDKVYTYYPYNKNNYGPVTSVRLSIPIIQKQDSTSYDASAMPMVGLPYTITEAISTIPANMPQKDPIYLCNLGSIIDYNVYTTNSTYSTEKIQSVAFSSDNAIAGYFTKDLTAINYADQSTLAISGYTEKQISTSAPALAIGSSKTDATDVYMVVAPGNHKGMVVVVTDKADYIFNVSTAITFLRNKQKTLNIDLAKATRVAVGAISFKKAIVNESQIGFYWSRSNFSDVVLDQSDAYTVGVYTDEACSALKFQWTFGNNGLGASFVESDLVAKCFQWAGNLYFPGIILSGLDPSTTYYVKVTDTVIGTSQVQSFTTTASQVVDVTKLTAAKAGDVILDEDFSQFLYGGHSPLFLSGYNSNLRGSATSMFMPAGDTPCTDATSKLFNVASNTHMGLFNTLSKFIPNSRLATWATYVEKNLEGAMCVESGCLKMGASSCTGDIVTPSLACLSGTATLKVEFDAAPYVEGSAANSEDDLTTVVEIFGKDATITSTAVTTKGKNKTYGANWVDYKVAGNAPTGTKTITLESVPSWSHYSVEISGVPAGARIGIGPKIADKINDQHRMYLDNIKITVVKYE